MKKLNRHILAALLAVIMVLAPCTAVNAADPDYTGDLDPVTNEAPDLYSGNTSERSSLSSTMLYDWSTHDFVYPVENSLIEVHANVADGMMTNQKVSIIAEDPSVLVFRDGEEIKTDLSNLKDPGAYTVTVNNGGGSYRLLDFTIVDKSSNSLHSFSVPEGFYIVSATRDAENVYQGRYELDMEEEGEYYIEYKCGPTDHVYKLDVEIDRTPPQLILQAKLDSKGRARSAVSFSGLEETDDLVLIKDGVQVYPTIMPDRTGTIADSGNYIMRVYDAAGNMREYQFTIMVYFNAGTWFFLLTVLAVIGAVAAYVIIKRKRLKIG